VLSFAMILGIGFLLLISMALTTALAALGGAVGSVVTMPEWLAHTLNFLLSFAVITVLFAAIFKVLPDIKLRWRDMWIGAIGTALLFTIGKYLLAWYLGRESTSSSYGAAGSVVVLLMWVYYGSVILFFGAEFTRAYVKQTGSQIALSKFAVPITEEEMAQQGMASEKKVAAATAAKTSPGKHQPKREAVEPAEEPLGVPVLGLTALAGFIIGTLLELQLSGRRSHARNAE
jgi:membrane protein